MITAGTVTFAFLLLTASLVVVLMGWDYISELQPPTGLLFIPQIIYEYREPWWNNTDREKLLICPPDFSANFTRSHLSVKQKEEHGKDNAEFCLQRISFILIGFINML
jgi:hypothetical protein